MFKKAGTWLLSTLILCVATTSLAQVTRYSFEAVATENLEVELGAGQKIHGQLRHVDDERAVILSDDGEVREVSFKDVAHLRVRSKSEDPTASKATAGESATERAQRQVDESIKRAEGADQSFAKSEPNAGYFEDGSSGYLSSPSASTDSPFSRAYHDQSPQQWNQGMTLSAIDYGHYRAMVRGSRVKRGIGWSMFATGVLFLTGAVHAASEARRHGYDDDYPGLVVFGALNTLVGLPVAIAGRQQYRRAAEFAREASEGRASIESDRQADAPVPAKDGDAGAQGE